MKNTLYEKDVVQRAFAAYFRGAKPGVILDQPAGDSGRVTAQSLERAVGRSILGTVSGSFSPYSAG